MKTAAALLTLTLLFVLVVTPHATHSGAVVAQGHHQSPTSPFERIISGKDNPAAISDAVAYDVFLRSLIFPPAEQEAADSRYRALAEEMRLSETRVGALRGVAAEFGRNVSALDRRASEIKQQHLPDLGQQDVRELIDLQKQKERLLTSTIASLGSKLDAATVRALQAYINSHVRQRVRSVAGPETAPTSAHGTGRGRRFLDAALHLSSHQTYHRVGMNGYGHLYLDGWKDMAAGYAYGRGLITEDYNAYRHTWSVETRVSNPDRSRATSCVLQWYAASFGSTCRIAFDFEDGDFQIECILKEICPYLGLIALGSFQGNPVPVPRFFVIGTPFFDEMRRTLRPSADTTTLTVSVTASRSIVAQDSITIEPGYGVTSGTGTVDMAITGLGTLTNFSAAETKPATFTYKVIRFPTSTVRLTGIVTGTATTTGPPPTPGVQNSPARTAENQLTVEP